MKDEELLHLIALTFADNLGDVTIKNLIASFGGAKEVFSAKKGHLNEVSGIGEINAKRIFDSLKDKSHLKKAEKEISFVNKRKARVLTFLDEDYPRRLKQCHDSPVLLYFDGSVNFNTEKVIGIVGTRKPTDYGILQTEKLVDELSDSGALIISGMAYGIDITAHRAALHAGLPTVGVMAHGLDLIYPGVHVSTAKKMLKNGGVLTEFPCNTNPDRENFPKRNRIVAGMCDALIVIESKLKGGSLITAEIASTYNRDVFAFPGRAGDENSEGCNAFIKSNKATLIESASDLTYAMGWDKRETKNKSQQIPLLLNLSKDEKLVVDLLTEKKQVHVDEIAAEAGITLSQMAALLLQLEFANIVRSLPGKMYSLN